MNRSFETVLLARDAAAGFGGTIARGAVRGAAAGITLAGAGLAFNAVALLLLMRAVAVAPGVASALSLPLATLVALVFCAAYVALGVRHARKVALRRWYQGHRAELIAALDRAVAEAAARSPGALRAAPAHVAAALVRAPRPVRMIGRWAVRRIGGERLARLLAADGGGAADRLDALVLNEFLAARTRSFWILLTLNAAAAAMALARVG